MNERVTREVMEANMTIRLDHTIVPVKDKRESAEFFAELFWLRVEPGQGHFAQVRVNEGLTFDFADQPELFAAEDKALSLHYAFQGSVLTRQRAVPCPYAPAPGPRQCRSAPWAERPWPPSRAAWEDGDEQAAPAAR